MVPHLISVLAEVGHGPIRAINGISLSFMFIEGLHHILNTPKFFLDVDVLLAGGLRLGVGRKHNLFTNHLTWTANQYLIKTWFHGHREEQKTKGKRCVIISSTLMTGFSASERHFKAGCPGSLLALWLVYSKLALALTQAEPGMTVLSQSLHFSHDKGQDKRQT